MVKTTGGPAMAASVDSPAMTAGAVSFLQEHLNNGEKALWSSLGPNWTLPRSVCVNILQIALHLTPIVSRCPDEVLLHSVPVLT